MPLFDHRKIILPGNTLCGRKSIHVDLGRFCEPLVQGACLGPGRPPQRPRFLPSVRVWHELDQRLDLPADDCHGLPHVNQPAAVIREVERVLLTELLEGEACGNTSNWPPYGSMQFRVGSLLVQLWFRVWC